MKIYVHLMWCEAWRKRCMCVYMSGVSMVWYFQHKVQELVYASVCVVKVVCS